MPDLSGGGAERIVVTFLKHLDREHFDPILIVCRASGVYLDSVPSDTPIFSLEKTSKWRFFSLVSRFKRIVTDQNLDVVVSFLWYADAIQLLAKSSLSPPAVCSFHSVPSAIKKEHLGWLKVLLLKSLYRRANRILAVSKSVAKEIDDLFLAGQKNKTFVQFNPFDFDQLVKRSKQQTGVWPSETATNIVFVGRLERVKGPDRFLEMLKLLPTNLDWHAKFVGTGSLQPALEQQVADSELGHRVDFDGFVSNPFPLIREADILVVTSRFEAFPSVIVEALMLKTTVVSYDCDSGPAEIINSENGVLVTSGDATELAQNIQTLIEQPQKANALAQNGPESVAHLDYRQATTNLELHLAQTISDDSANRVN